MKMKNSAIAQATKNGFNVESNPNTANIGIKNVNGNINANIKNIIE